VATAERCGIMRLIDRRCVVGHLSNSPRDSVPAGCRGTPPLIPH
jgi:hypothetical protein